MATLNRTDYNLAWVDTSGNFTDNTTRLITESKMRSFAADVMGSTFFLSEDTTDSITEGVTNLFFTAARAKTATFDGLNNLVIPYYASATEKLTDTFLSVAFSPSSLLTVTGNTYITGSLGIGVSPSYELHLNSGNIRIPTTTASTTGVILQGAARFIHSYGANSLFFGSGAGNFTFTGTGYNLGIGVSSLSLLTTGYHNVTIGVSSGQATTTGYQNTYVGVHSGRNIGVGYANVAIGDAAMYSTASNSAYNNVAVGKSAMYSITTGYQNVAIGQQALEGITTGNNNIAIGESCAENLTTGSGNIFIGQAINSPAAGTNNYLSIGNVIYGNLSSSKIGIGGTGLTSMFNVGSSDNFQISSAGKIAKYNNTAITNGKILIGHTANGTFELASITAGTAISITESAGGITIDCTAPGASDAAADGVTKGGATFDADDFNDDGAGLISIDYANGQAAGALLHGFVTVSAQTFAGTKTFSSVTYFSDGAAATPSVAFSSNTDTGMYYASNAIRFSINAAERFRIEDGFISISSNNEFTQQLNVNISHDGASQDGGYAVSTYSDTYTNTFGGRRARGTAALPTATQSGDALVEFIGKGHDGSGWESTNRGVLGFYASENHSPGNHGAYFLLKNTLSGSTVARQVLKVDDSGNLLLSQQTSVASTPTTWTASSDARYLEIRSQTTVTEDVGLFLHNSNGQRGIDLWMDCSALTSYLDSMTDSGSSFMAFRMRTKGTAVNAITINAAGQVGIGNNMTSPASAIHVDAGTATASALKFTAGTTTGQTASDGLEIGITTAGAGELRLKENQSLTLYQNDTAALTFNSNQNILTRNSGSPVYRTTNGGSNITPAAVWDISGSLATGNAVIIDSTYHIGFTRSNGTRRILRSAIQVVDTTDTANSEAGGLGFLTQSAGAALTEKFRITSKGSVLLAVQGALSTSATDGFTYIPTCAGVPSGVPTAQTGMVALVFDTTNNHLYLYDGSWIKTTVFS